MVMYSGCHKNLIYHLNSPSYENGGENGWRAWHLGCVLEAHEGKYHDLVDFFADTDYNQMRDLL